MAARRSPRRREVLDVLRAAPAPLGVAAVAERMGVHPNTVRFHLDALMAEGLVESGAEAPSGPGRPRTAYRARPGMDRGGARGYPLLARMLLSRWASADPAEARAEAEETGRAWGRLLVDEPPTPPTSEPPTPPTPEPPTPPISEPPTPPASEPPTPPISEPPTPPTPEPPTAERAAARLVGLLDDMGFAPRPEGVSGPGGPPARIRLEHCPFLELAEEYGRLVCPLHLGLMQGALSGLGAPLTATGLQPFAEPGFCLAHLGGARTAEQKGATPR
ncbi:MULTISPECIES: helix-turn-helix transcriptional regulator [unclassified Streptomyces]|uniref:helix-turn-helix transcriptional regulator n=1 Tax=unclassified Streptomyces TaxID=2593676 RepID=UPI0036AD41DD